MIAHEVRAACEEKTARSHVKRQGVAFVAQFVDGLIRDNGFKQPQTICPLLVSEAALYKPHPIGG